MNRESGLRSVKARCLFPSGAANILQCGPIEDLLLQAKIVESLWRVFVHKAAVAVVIDKVDRRQISELMSTKEEDRYGNDEAKRKEAPAKSIQLSQAWTRTQKSLRPRNDRSALDAHNSSPAESTVLSLCSRWDCVVIFPHEQLFCPRLRSCCAGTLDANTAHRL